MNADRKQGRTHTFLDVICFQLVQSGTQTAVITYSALPRIPYASEIPHAFTCVAALLDWPLKGQTDHIPIAFPKKARTRGLSESKYSKPNLGQGIR